MLKPVSFLPIAKHRAFSRAAFADRAEVSQWFPSTQGLIHRILLIVFGAACFSGSQLLAVLQVGNGDIFLDSRLNLAYDSNLFLQETDAESDMMAILYAGAGFTQRQRSVLNVEGEIGFEIIRMDEFSAENAEDFKSNFLVSYPNNIEHQGYIEISGGYNENTQANADIGQRIELGRFDLEGRFEQGLTDKIGLELTASTQDERYRDGIDPNNNLALDRDSEILAFGLAGTYAYSEKLMALLRYSHRDLEYDDLFSVDQKGDIFSIGLRGILTPKITGSLSVGFQDLSLRSDVIPDDDYTDPFYSIDLEWAPRDKTTVTLYGSNDFQASVYGDVNNRSLVGLEVNEQLSDKAAMNIGVEYSDNEYAGLFERDDQSLRFTAGYFFAFDDFTQFSAQISHEDRDSRVEVIDFEGLGFDRLFVSLGISKVW